MFCCFVGYSVKNLTNTRRLDSEIKCFKFHAHISKETMTLGSKIKFLIKFLKNKGKVYIFLPNGAHSKSKQ